MIAINESIAKASPINTIATVLMLESLDSFLFKVILLCDFCDFSLLRRRGENLLDNFLFIVLFYRKFRLCITALQATPASGKAHTPKDARVFRLSLRESSRRSRVRGGVIATICPLRRLRRHLSQRARLSAHPIITQIGRENKFSAEVLRLPIFPLRMQRERSPSFVFLLFSLYNKIIRNNFLSEQGLGGAWELATAKAREIPRADCLFTY